MVHVNRHEGQIALARQLVRGVQKRHAVAAAGQADPDPFR